MAGWITRQQDSVIDYLREENRVLKQQLGRTTISNILKENGIDSADFFSVEAWARNGTTKGSIIN